MKVQKILSQELFKEDWRASVEEYPCGGDGLHQPGAQRIGCGRGDDRLTNGGSNGWLRKIWCNYNGIKLSKKKNGTRHRRYPTIQPGGDPGLGAGKKDPIQAEFESLAIPSDQEITVIFDFNCWSWSLWVRNSARKFSASWQLRFQFVFFHKKNTSFLRSGVFLASFVGRGLVDE